MENNQSSAFPINYYLSLIARRRWFILVPFCLAMVVGIFLSIYLPKKYESSTLILIRPANVPDRYVQSIVTADIETRINTISQQILSRTNLEKIIDQFHLFQGSEGADVFMEDKIASLRNRITVEVSRTHRRADADAFSITFMDQDPQKAMRVTNGLANAFIDENLKVREAQAVGTSDFLEAELETTRKRLAVVEEKLKEYRRENMGELPEQLESNLRILDRLQAQLSDKEESLRNARVTLSAISSQIQIQRQQAAAAASAAVVPQAPQSGPDNQLTLAQMKEKLANLQSTYTERHPDVVRLKGQIAKLEADLGSAPGGVSSSGGSATAVQPVAGADPALVSQRVQLGGVIRSIEIEIGRIQEQIAEYQRRIEATPKREQELLTLRRDYENIQESYNSLLDRKLEAEIAVNMEKKQKGEQFRIIDPARLPERPVSPDMRKLFLLAVAAGLGIGLGLIYFLEMMDTSLKRPDDFENNLGIPVLATVPRILRKRDRVKMRVHQAATAATIVVALLLVGSLAVLVFNGVEPTLDVLRTYTSL
jgi:polysaccharide chain length determinant protein (PEP-CTERM system associated)